MLIEEQYWTLKADCPATRFEKNIDATAKRDIEPSGANMIVEDPGRDSGQIRNGRRCLRQSIKCSKTRVRLHRRWRMRATNVEEIFSEGRAVALSHNSEKLLG